MEYMHSSGRQLAMLRKNQPDPTLEMSPGTADGGGIRDGDWVWLETIYFGDKERIKFRANVVKGFCPKAVFSVNGWWFPEMSAPEHGVFEANPNVVIPAEPCDPIFGSANIRSVPCRIYKA